jgi:hypothetical protein
MGKNGAFFMGQAKKNKFVLARLISIDILP